MNRRLRRSCLPRSTAVTLLTLATQVSLAVLVTLAPLSSQQTELSVSDLLGSAGLSARLQDDAQPRLDWIDRETAIGEGDASIMGEHLLLRDCATRPWFVADALQTILAALTRLDASRFQLEGTTLLVERADAAATREALAQLRRQLPPTIDLELMLERKSEAGRQTLMHVRQQVPAGRTSTFEDLVTRRIVRDYEVEIAQSASSANPVVGRLATGTCLAARTRVVPGKGEVLLELFARVAGVAAVQPIQTLHDGLGPIDRAARQLDESGFAMRLPRGARRTVGWTAGNGDRLLLTAAVGWQDPPAGPGRGVVVRCLGLFHKPVAEFRTDVPELEAGPAAFAAAAAYRRGGAESVLIVENEEGAMPAIIVTGAKAEQIDVDITSRLARTLRAVELEVSLIDVAAGVVLAKVAQEGTTLARIESPVIVGKSVAFSGRTEMRYLRDWDIEVAHSARIPDPKVDVLRHGYQLDARVVADAEGRPGAVAIQASVVRLLRIDVTRAVLSREVRVGGGSDKEGSSSPSIVIPGDVVGIESPVLKRHSVETLMQLDGEGAAVLRRAAPGLLGEDRELVVIVRVKQ